MSQLPPGRSGLPLIGELLPFARDGFAFVNQRIEAHGTVFRTRLFGADWIVLSGAEAAAVFADEANVQRAGAFPSHIVSLFGKGAVNQVDDQAHRARKAHVMAALGPEALVHYLPTLRTLSRAAVADWVARGEVKLIHEAKLLSLRIIAATIRGESPTPEALAEQSGWIQAVGAGVVAPPIDLPGTRLHKAIASQKALCDLYRADIAARRARPGEDGVSRMLAHEVDGERLTDAEAVYEVHHVVLAGYIVWSFFTWGLQQLAENPEWESRLRAAIASLPADPGARALAEIPELQWTVLEIKRTDPVLPLIIGKARRDFEVGGYRIPAGTTLGWALHASHNHAAVSRFDHPERFDPGRYAPERAEHTRHPQAFSPQGPGDVHRGHKCGGVDLSSLMAQVFLVELLRGSRFTLPPQDLSLDVSASPAEQRSGLVVRFTSA